MKIFLFLTALTFASCAQRPEDVLRIGDPVEVINKGAFSKSDLIRNCDLGKNLSISGYDSFNDEYEVEVEGVRTCYSFHMRGVFLKKVE